LTAGGSWGRRFELAQIGTTREDERRTKTTWGGADRDLRRLPAQRKMTGVEDDRGDGPLDLVEEGAGGGRPGAPVRSQGGALGPGDAEERVGRACAGGVKRRTEKIVWSILVFV